MTQPYHHGDLRTALLDAAETILDRDGIAGLTLRAAARQAGVSHAAPTHHFGDLAGLLTALATTGYIRLRATIQGAIAAAGPGMSEQIIAGAHGYVGFAASCPGLFQLMFRSERLDWSQPSLAIAGAEAFALLTAPDASPDTPPTTPSTVATFITAMTRWSLMHGLATLLTDGRLASMTEKLPGTTTKTLIDAILATGLARP